MRDVLLPVVRRFARTLAVMTAPIAAALAVCGRIELLGALFVGYAAGAVVLWGMAHRVWRSAGFTPARAKREMLWGLFLRLFVLFAVLGAAAHIGAPVFWTAAGGFLLLYALFLLHLIAAQGSTK